MSDKVVDGIPEQIQGAPTKRFFVSMLVRDIGLKDAILDLVDNCVDGAMRSLGGVLDGETPYEGFSANISISSESFEIIDNCGGISPEIIENAFRLGRPDVERDAALPTVGMYGIGMKRAIFKMGRNAIVETRSDKGEFSIGYTEEWLSETNDDWMLDVAKSVTGLEGIGTRIHVDKLVPPVAKAFSAQSFVSELRDAISMNYGYILTKGFKVVVNGNEVAPVTLQIRANLTAQDNQISPFVYEGEYEGVNIFVTVGFFRPLPKALEIDEELEGASHGEEAGISIICNDRVVVHNDRTRLTGWGEQRVPKYHTQFSSISGFVIFTSNHANNLPLTTTKRGIDQDTQVYWLARDQLIKGIKLFTDFTNKWKGREDETYEVFKAAPKVAALEYRNSVRSELKKVRGDEAGGAAKIPILPKPEDKNPMRRISFLRSLEQIEAVSLHLLDDAKAKPSEIGAMCFDKILKETSE